MKRILMAGVILGALASTSAADRADDDLAAVKKAVGTTVEAEATPPAEQPAPPRAEKVRAEERRVAERARSRKSEPQWIRVRIAEKGEKHARVSLNLPLGIVSALGEDLKIEDCHDEHHCHAQHTVGDLLRALDSGERLVDIEDEEATVHVWVE
jgi:hypothetical protein